MFESVTLLGKVNPSIFCIPCANPFPLLPTASRSRSFSSSSSRRGLRQVCRGCVASEVVWWEELQLRYWWDDEVHGHCHISPTIPRIARPSIRWCFRTDELLLVSWMVGIDGLIDSLWWWCNWYGVLNVVLWSNNGCVCYYWFYLAFNALVLFCSKNQPKIPIAKPTEIFECLMRNILI